MSRLRCALRLSVLMIATAALFTLWILSRPVALVSRGLALRSHQALFGGWARTMARVLRLEVRTEGTPPTPPFLLVTNHLGYLDVVTLSTLVDARFLSRADVARWPVIGFLARAMGTLFIERERKRDLPGVGESIAAVLSRGEGVILFPEGTSTGGDDVLPFRPSLFEVAVRSGVPVSTATISYSTPPGSPPAARSVCWWGDMTFGRHFLALVSLPSIQARVLFGATALWASDRKQLAEEAWEAVRSQLPRSPGQPVASALS